MAGTTRSERERQRGEGKATLAAHPRSVVEGDRVELVGEGVPDCGITLTVGGKPVAVVAIADGSPDEHAVRPNGAGRFSCVVDTFGWGAGSRRLAATPWLLGPRRFVHQWSRP